MKYRRQMAENLWKENAKEVSDFLDNLGVKETFSEISTTSIVSQNFKARNILYIIRLLTGKCSVPVSEEEDVDMDYLDDKFMRRERKRESWKN